MVSLQSETDARTTESALSDGTLFGPASKSGAILWPLGGGLKDPGIKGDSTVVKLVFCLAVALTASSTAWADKGETDRLADRADAVVVGELLSGKQAGQSLSFVLSVTRILKGDLTSGATVNVSGRTRLSLSGSLRGHYGIWILQRTGTQWRLLPLLPGAAALETSGYLPVSKLSSPASVVTSSPPQTANDRIAIEMAAAIQSYTDRKQLFNLAYGLQGATESGFLRDIYLSLRTNFDPEIRFIGLSRPFGPDDDLLTLAEIANNLDLDTYATSSWDPGSFNMRQDQFRPESRSVLGKTCTIIRRGCAKVFGYGDDVHPLARVAAALGGLAGCHRSKNS